MGNSVRILKTNVFTRTADALFIVTLYGYCATMDEKARTSHTLALLFLLSSSISNMGIAATGNVYHKCTNPDPTNHLEIIGLGEDNPYFYAKHLQIIRKLLEEKSAGISKPVIEKTLAALSCANLYHIEHKQILTIIDFSKPASEKRLWIYDLDKGKLLYNTHVSHGIKSGILHSNYFSNKHNSKASSIGIYKTDKAYYGRHGVSLRLAGLERGFNNNAYNRAIVMHGGWYVDEEFVKKYGRAGRSWGCPAVPKKLTRDIINTIKEDGFFVAYYPSEPWYLQSKYLNCKKICYKPYVDPLTSKMEEVEEQRGDILFVEKNNNNRREENEPIITMSATDYKAYLRKKPPLKRMLRRQIEKEEYIALNARELEYIIDKHPELLQNEDDKKKLHFVIPEVKNKRGYWATEMKIINLGDIKDIRTNNNSGVDPQRKTYTLVIENKKDKIIKSSNYFIRWLGL